MDPMKRIYFTPERLEALKPKRGKQYYVSDIGAPGLVVLVSPGGTKSYVARTYPGGKLVYTPSFGRFGEIYPRDLEAEIEEMRTRAREARRDANNGIDPRSRRLKVETFEALVEAYAAEQANRDKAKGGSGKGAMDNQRFVLRACPEWAHRPINKIGKDEVKALLRQIRDAGNAPTAIRLQSHLSAIFRWAVAEDLLTKSPLAGVEMIGGEIKRRDLPWFKGEAADKAIKAIWSAADEIGGDGGKLLKLLLLTGKRRGAIEKMRWEEIDSKWFWSPSQEGVAENKKLLPVPLARVLSPRKESGLVLKAGDRTKLQNRVKELTGIDTFIFHGCRHIVETGLAALKVQKHVRDLLLDHARKRKGGGVYDHHEYDDEMRAAMEQWAGYVARLVQPAEAVAVLR